MIERYLYDVVRRLPEKQRDDIRKELSGLIEDMLEECEGNGKSKEENIKQVLEKLGDPAELAAKYRGSGQYLIGGEYYPIYCRMLKLVLICVAAGMGISVLVRFFITVAETSIGGVIASATTGFIDLFSIPMGLVEAFGIVTLLFVILERNHIRLQNSGADWKIENLPPVPEKNAVISREKVLSELWCAHFLVLFFLCVPEYIGPWIKNSEGMLVAVPVFNMEIWGKVVPFLIISFLAGIPEEAVKLIAGRYNQTVMWTSVICNSISIGCAIWIFKMNDIWNPQFVVKISSLTGHTFSAKYDILTYWNSNLPSNAFLCLIIFGSVVSMAEAIYRTLRYGVKGNR